MNEQEILELKERIAKIKTDNMQLKGQLKVLNRQLKDLGYKNVDEAKFKVKSKKREFNKITTLIEEKTAELETFFQ